jgi:hypothetical protein
MTNEYPVLQAKTGHALYTRKIGNWGFKLLGYTWVATSATSRGIRYSGKGLFVCASSGNNRGPSEAGQPANFSPTSCNGTSQTC